MSVYDVLAELMVEKGITAAELSRRTGLRKQYFSDLKHGRADDISLTNAIKIFDALGITANEFTERWRLHQ